MHCALDDLIPFNEWFLIPYLFWFVYLIGAVAYTFFFDVPGFRRMMRFVMITYSVTLIIYFLFPTCQMLRPEVFPTRQCPHALHRGVLRVRHEHERLPVAACHRLNGGIFFRFLVCAHLLQARLAHCIDRCSIFYQHFHRLYEAALHSDVAAAIPLCAIGYYFAYVRTPKKSRSAVPDVTR